MMKQHWWHKGYDAFWGGQPKMMTWDKGGKHFNQGWDAADEQRRLDEEVEKHNKLAGELEHLKNRICDYGDDLDLDCLTELLYDMGARA